MIFLLLLILIIVICSYLWYHRKPEGQGEGEEVYGSFEDKMHEFYTGAEWFKRMKAGEKTLDIRPGPLERHKKVEGQTVKYFHGEEHLLAHVDKIVHYDSVAEAIKKEDWKKLGPQFKSPEEYKKAMDVFYTDETVASAGGVNILHLSYPGGAAKVKSVAKIKSAAKSKSAVKKGKAERKKHKKRKHGGDPQFDYDYDHDLTGL